MKYIIDRMHKNLPGNQARNANFSREVKEVINFYSFYDGQLDNPEELVPGTDYGQVWPVPENLDYKPTREVRNLTKKLIDKQSRFMFGVPPTITFKPYNKAQKDLAEEKRALIDFIFKNSGFWGATKKAFLDATIGKRVLLMIVSNPGEPIQFRYFKMHEFTFAVNPNNCNEITSVQICYQDESTVGKLVQEERWHKWTYQMRNGACWCIYEIVDGLDNETYIEVPQENNPNDLEVPVEKVPFRQEFNTGFTKIPCRVITNGGLTGDIQGTSDVKELIDLAMSYNKVNSDYRDALRFKMFEQPVFTDADSTYLKDIKIAPNAIIDLKTDPTIGDGTSTGRSATAAMLSSTFNFAEAADSYLTRLKQDMYELMDQPLPEQLKDVPSGKALRFLFFDLMARCDEKWLDWEPAVEWAIDLCCEACNLFNLYPELKGKQVSQVLTNTIIDHNYPVPEDEEITKEIAVKEVEANVLSRKSYIRKYGDVEDEQGEWDEIMEEMEQLNGLSDSGVMHTMTDPITTEPGPTQVAGEGMEDDL